MQFNELPVELQYHVFSFLSQEELMKFVAPVCRSWYQMAYDPLFWTSLTFIGFTHSAELVIRILKLSVFVTNLVISYFEVEFDWFLILPKRETLRVLWLDHCSGIDDKSLSIFVDRFPFVEKFTFSSASDFDEKLVQQINRWKIKKLIIDLYESSNANREKCINCIAKNFHQLKDLVLGSDFVMSDRSFLTLGKMKGKQLTKFHLFGFNLRDSILKILGESFCNVTELCLGAGCLLSKNFLMPLKHLENMRSLKIDQSDWYDDTRLSSFVLSLKEARFYNVIELIYDECPLTNNTIKLFPKCFPSLQKLYLNDGCDVTEKGLKAAMSGFRNLNFLSLRFYEKVTGKCFLYFPPNLSTLKISNCYKITDATVQEISLKRQNVNVIRLEK